MTDNPVERIQALRTAVREAEELGQSPQRLLYEMLDEMEYLGACFNALVEKVTTDMQALREGDTEAKPLWRR